MQSPVKRLVFWLWPPYEAQLANQTIIERAHTKDTDAKWDSILHEYGKSLPLGADLKEIEGIVQQIHDSESKRKETLEAKASTYASGMTIALSIIALASTLFADKTMPLISTIIFGSLYLIAVVYLLAATFSAVQARRVQAFAVLSADSFLDALKTGDWRARERIAITMGYVKWNESVLLCKSNWLSVAEDLFMRGIMLVSLSVLGNLVLKIWIALTLAHPTSLPALFFIPTTVP